MSFRVIAGAYKGRRLETPEGSHTRPLTDRIREALFNCIGPSCDNLRVIDICAGSGAFGIEAASRGAKHVVQIDNDRQAQTCMRQNYHHLGNPDSLQLRPGGFLQHLPHLRDFDLLFADPPFPWFREQREQLSHLLELSEQSLRPGGLLLIRGERGQELPQLPSELIDDDQRSYGRSWVRFMYRTGSQ